MLRSTTVRRQSRGFTLMLALGVVALVTMAVMLSYSIVGREADTQGDSRRHKEAFFAAEAGLAEGREAMRLLAGIREVYNNTTTGDLGGHFGGIAVNEAGLGSGDPDNPWYEVLPGGGADRWNYLRLTPEAMPDDELQSSDGVAYENYPIQNNVRYRVFVTDDEDKGPGDVDFNGNVWLISVGEVVTPNGRPTRAVVRALIANQNLPGGTGGNCPTGGCGPDNTYSNTMDQRPPNLGHNTTL